MTAKSVSSEISNALSVDNVRFPLQTPTQQDRRMMIVTPHDDAHRQGRRNTLKKEDPLANSTEILRQHP